MKGSFKPAVFALLLSLALPVSLLLFSSGELAAVAPAPCHEDAPNPDSPPVPNHDCCILGHSYAITAQQTAVSPLFIAFAEPAQSSFTISFQPRPEPALTSFDPPAETSPLRI